MNKMLVVTTAIVYLFTKGSHADGYYSRHTLQGFVSHGVNTYNGEPIADYSSVSPLVPWLQEGVQLQEIGVIDPGSTNAAVITQYTDRSLPVATIRSVFDFFNPNGNVNPQLFNQPLDAIGSSPSGYTDLTERVPRITFDNARAGQIHASKHTNERPTVSDWEQISGQIRLRCRVDGTANARVYVRNAMPEAVYTLWDVGVLSPLTANEQGYAVPFGGIPNVLLTDQRGRGYKTVDLMQCPLRPCETGADSCTSYISAFYHWDGQVYGGAPAATFAGMPVGVVASNQMVWPTSGEILIDPPTDYWPTRATVQRH